MGKDHRTPAWIGVDLDGTLAYYDIWRGPSHIGAPIYPTVYLVQRLVQEGYLVKIFTARVAHPEQKDEAEKAIKEWTAEHIGTTLEVTNVKDMGMILLIDDRAIQAEHNTGHLIFRKNGRTYDSKIFDTSLLPIERDLKWSK